jgi:hypothetical protein
MLPLISSVLGDILGVAPPVLTLEVLDDGKRWPTETDEMRDRTSPFFLLSVEGEPGTVGLLTDGEYFAVIMSPTSNLGYALGAAVAITVARRFGGIIEDAHRFFGPVTEATSEQMLLNLRLPRSSMRSIREAAEDLLIGDKLL